MMKTSAFSKVEQSFFDASGRDAYTTMIPYIVVPNVPALGMLAALRFLEWVDGNPEGVISLPTGKTPEYFIKWTSRLLNGWDDKENRALMERHGLSLQKKPSLRGLRFVQTEDFYPIDPEQHNSYYHYVTNFYIRGFDLDPTRALLINANEIQLAQGKHYSEVFPDNIIDLSLRNREAGSNLEKLQQESLFRIDNWCMSYENRIREMGGIGFYLGGMGPDGSMASNTRGSDHNSTTRLTATNFENQAASASDLGGIEVSLATGWLLLSDWERSHSIPMG